MGVSTADEIFHEENNSEYLQQRGGQVVVYKYLILKAPVTPLDVVPFVIVFGLYCLAIHSVLAFIKKINKNVHSFIQFIFVIVFPPIVMMISADYFFITMWIGLMIFCGYCLRISFNKQLLRSNNPKKIYKMFRQIFIYTNICIAIGQVMTLLSVIFKLVFASYSFRWLFYSLYFAVFCREVMGSLSKIMGRTTGVIASTPMGDREDNPDKCMICVESLIDYHGKMFTNGCGHSYHNECLKGWLIIGNNNHCISCKTGINIDLIKPDLWDKTEVAVKPLMNFLRSSISFFVVICLFIVLRLR
ncbi:RN121 [Hepatospora eriocheir]|uniref:RN121 n=1 Tax=Hepatospora eriocheir TaxID=1081669 RepID=A0A1X0QJP2_9MICR|nr:RN121 [Hepatospora eriocheir]